jgi:acyl dehydratase
MTFPERLTLRCGPVSAVDLALFAAASGDHNPLHLDAEVARRAGFERPVVHGMLMMAYAARLLTQAFGAARVRSLHTRFVGVALLGDTIDLEATLQRNEGGDAHYALRAFTTAGTELAAGTAQVAPVTP